MSYHCTPIRMAILKKKTVTNVGKAVQKREPSYTVGGKVNWYSHYGKQFGGFSEN